MLRTPIIIRWLPALAASALFLTVSPAEGWPRYVGPPETGGYADPFPPSYYGYNLDDTHPGYYGGGRYREYYGYGRGIGVANFPGFLPGYPYAYVRRPIVNRPPAPPAGPLSETLVPHDAVAYLEVRAPADAEVWLEGVKSEQSGATRLFTSPPLVPGKSYAYEVRARWVEDGRDVEQTQNVIVHGGGRFGVIFPAGTKAEDLPKPLPLPLQEVP